MNKRLKQRKNLHLRCFDYKGSAHVYFVTICTADKIAHFKNDHIVQIISDELEYRRVAGEIKLFCYCIMPDHLHLLISLGESYQKNLQNFITAFKRYTSRTVKMKFVIKPLWQKNFHEHVVRREESLVKIAKYILNNPVRKGIISNWKGYKHCKLVDPLPL